MQGRSLEEAAEELAKELAKDDEIWRRNAKDLQTVSAEALDFQPVDVDIPPIPMLAHGLDRVLFNPSVYRLQDPRSRVYNFDPYLEKIMPVTEFDFESLSAYKTSSKDDKLLAITKRLGVKFTGSTSSMSGVLQHFHYLLSNWRKLNHHGLSRQFPDPSGKFTRITTGPQAIFLRWKNGAYAIDADKAFDSPNVMSWLGHSMEKLLTSTPDEFERYRRSNPEQAPSEVESGKSYHYSRLGNFLMRSQLDAHDPRLPGTGVFDLKTRAVLAIRMDHARYEKGAGYQLRYDQGQWESFEREDYDMARATMLKYSMQARMGRMDGIFVAYHNVERIFGFQYFSLSDMDYILHGQRDTCLGDKEFKLSVSLLDEILQRATAKYPETSIRLHFETLAGRHPAMSIYAEPVTEERVEEIQLTNAAAMREFEEKHVRGISEDAAQEIVDENVMDELTGNDKSGEEDVATSDGEAAAGALPKQQDITDATAPDTDPPLMGWTLTCRNRVNGQFVRQVTDLGPSDDYSIEYLVRDIAPDTQRKGYNMLKERRRALFDFHNKVEDVRLKIYRAQINKITRQGREWRDEQDKIDEQMSKLVYRPLGPGSEKVIQEMGPSHAVHW
ncbi:Pet127-domain-containing protein [Melanomma pulvis-pyrius CBS 109.77]|uniref:Pet127-domain-containing protein n=1 Tax=Melanomma pulvis-pyrius CBS 109.77 TaxID=1314802 RepID=A0A6A6WV58_9PLEO|nr:Pet127-domain-containing protein [Melanomma pulvis-pyrius CBS 109.77]